MSATTKYLVAFVIISGIALNSCYSSKHNSAGVENAMKYYDHLILKLDADSIALLFTPEGHLGEIAIGRDSIKKFLSTFKNIRVLSQVSTTKTIDIVADTAIQKGTYRQSDIIAERDTVYVKGEYTATWLWQPKEGWRIKKMETKPVN